MASELIRIGQSPDPDDAFMFYALANELIPTEGFRVEHILRDIETLNRWALEGRSEVTVIRCTRTRRGQKYWLLPHGASMARSTARWSSPERSSVRPSCRRCASRCPAPGPARSSSQLAVGRIAEPVLTPFDEILYVVADGKVDAGLVIHEGQLNYETQGLVNILDLGSGGTSSPGVCPGAGQQTRSGGTWPMRRPARLSHLLRDRIAYALEHGTGVEHAEQFGGGLDMDLRTVRRHVRLRADP